MDIFTGMMMTKTGSLKDQAELLLREILARVPFVSIKDLAQERGPAPYYSRADLLLTAEANKRTYTLTCKLLTNGEPRYVRSAVRSLRQIFGIETPDELTLIAAPYLSEQAQEICIESDVGYLDFEGNCRLVFDGIFIERVAATKPVKEKRVLRSLFSPKSTQVLRVLLRDSSRAWRVAELAKAAQVSLGHVSNVRKSLLDREWAEIGPDGFLITQPAFVLEAWREVFEPLAGERSTYRTHLAGSALLEAVKLALRQANAAGSAMLASYSAAPWLAPYYAGTEIGCSSTDRLVFYADEAGVACLARHLALTPASRGENVIIVSPANKDILRDKVEPVQGIFCTSPLQTYLDVGLRQSERDRIEATDQDK